MSSLPLNVEALAADFAAAWTELFGCETHVAPAEPSDPAPGGCCRAVCEWAASTEPMLWELDRQLVGSIVDVQAGAEDTTPARTHGPLTGVEEALVRRAMEALRRNVNRQRLCEDSGAAYLSRIGDVLSLSEGAPSWPTSEPWLADNPLPRALRFQVHLLQCRGLLTWWLAPEHLALLAPPAATPAAEQWTALLSEFELPRADLQDLSVGDVIMTDQGPDEPVVLVSDSGQRRRALLGQAGDWKAVQPCQDAAGESSDQHRP